MASRAFVFQLESIWGWQIGSVSFPPLLSSEELFSINYGYFFFFFLKCPGSVEQVRCNCVLLVLWRVPPGWLAGQGSSQLVQGCSEVLPVFPARTVLLLLLLLGKCRTIWGNCMQSVSDSNEENFSLKILKKIWLVLQRVFYVVYILYKVSLI